MECSLHYVLKILQPHYIFRNCESGHSNCNLRGKNIDRGCLQWVLPWCDGENNFLPMYEFKHPV